MLPTPHMTAALRAAITLAAITAGANPEHRPAIGVAAKPLPENNFPGNRHTLFQAAFDNVSGSYQGKPTLGLSSFWHEGYLQRTPLLEQRGSFLTAFSRKHLATSSLWTMIDR
jgi:hypothetical protein